MHRGNFKGSQPYIDSLRTCLNPIVLSAFIDLKDLHLDLALQSTDLRCDVAAPSRKTCTLPDSVFKTQLIDVFVSSQHLESALQHQLVVLPMFNHQSSNTSKRKASQNLSFLLCIFILLHVHCDGETEGKKSLLDALTDGRFVSGDRVFNSTAVEGK